MPFRPPARTILSWAGRPQNNSAAEGVLRDLCAPIGPSIATLARGRGPDYARAAVGRVPQVRVQSLQRVLVSQISGDGSEAQADADRMGHDGREWPRCGVEADGHTGIVHFRCEADADADER